MPTPSTTMSLVWPSRTVLDVHPGSSSFTCVGKTKKGERCRNSFFSHSDLARANYILDRIAFLHPSSSHTQRYLMELAEIMLCPRWHRKPGYSQVPQVVRNWIENMESYGAVLQSAAVPSNDVQNERVSLRVGLNTTGRVLPREGGNEISSVVARNLSSSVSFISTPRVTSTSNSNLQLPTPSVTPEPASRSNSRSSRSGQISPISNLNSLTRRSSPVVSTLQRSSPASPTSSTQVSPPSQVSTILPNTPPSQTSSPAPPRSSIVRRRVRMDDCPICYDSIFFLEDAVWCQAQCGQNFHKGCFEQWERTCPSARVKCAFCRSEWKYDDHEE